jgi:hypothetical protein
MTLNTYRPHYLRDGTLDRAFKAGEVFRAYPPPEVSTYTGVQMDRDPRFNTRPDG